MAINPNLLVIKPVDELQSVTGLQAGELLFYDGSNNLKKIDIDTFNNLSKTAKPLKPTDVAPTEEGLYIPTQAGTYANAGGLIAQEGYYTLFFFNGANWTKSEMELPTKDIVNNVTNVTNNYTVDPNQIVPSEALYVDDILAGDILKRVDKRTGTDVNFRVTAQYFDGSTMDDSKVDNFFYIKRQEQYYEKQFKGEVMAEDFGVIPGAPCADNLQRAIDFASVKKMKLKLPAGTMILEHKIMIPNFTFMEGQGANLTIFSNQYSPLQDDWLFENADKNATRVVHFTGFATLYSKTFFKIDATQSEYFFRDMTHAELDTYIDCDSLFQVSLFSNVFIGAKKGLILHGTTTNLNEFHQVTFNCKNAIDFKTSEASAFNFCRFEGNPATDGSYCIKTYNAKAMTFKTCYFENTTADLLRDEGVENGITFETCHFTGGSAETLGAIGSGWQDYKFNSDGIVCFVSPNFSESDGICKTVNVRGITRGYLRSENSIIHKDVQCFQFTKQLDNLSLDPVRVLSIVKKEVSGQFGENGNVIDGQIRVSFLYNRTGGFLGAESFLFDFKGAVFTVLPIISFEAKKTIINNGIFDCSLSTSSSGNLNINSEITLTPVNNAGVTDLLNVKMVISVVCNTGGFGEPIKMGL